MKSNVLKRVLASSLMMVMLTGVLACGSPAKQASENEDINTEAMGESETAYVDEPEGKYEGYKLVWNDEFDGDALDTTKWSCQIGTGTSEGLTDWGNQELEYYTDEEKNVRVEDGNLVITAIKEEERVGGKMFTSARLRTMTDEGEVLFATKYGRVEARIKLPEGEGLWPAFWMLGESGSWPKCGEIDIMEHVGYLDNRASFALHTQEKNGMNGRNWHATHFFDYPLSNDFHVYGVEWCQEEENGKDCIRFFVDGVEYATAWENKIGDHDSWPFYKPHYFILNLAIGGNMGGRVDDAIFNQQRIMYVDWVRVYQRQEIQ